MSENASGSITFVAAGPGDPELITFAGAKAIAQADLLVVDSADIAERLTSAGIEARGEVVTAVADEVGQLTGAVADGLRVVRLTRGDFFSAKFRREILPAVLAEDRIHTHIIPGVSRYGAVLTYGAVAPTHTWSGIDASRGVTADAWPNGGTVIIWTRPEHLADVVARGSDVYGADTEVLEITGLGTTSQNSRLVAWKSLATGAPTAGECYLITGPGIGTTARQRLDWFASKPLFDWNVLVPRTKDDLDELTAQLDRYGATTEVVPTMSIEPPRTEQGMERAVRGLIDGRYLWIVFTSPHAVGAVMERLDEYGLDSRALSGVNIAAVGRVTSDVLCRHGLKADLEPSGENTVGGLAGEFPAFDDLIDPLNRVLVPSADVSVAALLEGLTNLGWEAEEVTAYRTVRAAPPPAEVRERIKTGMFDAVLFTSSTAVRNMIGIAGKPHNLTVVAAIGPATAQACEMHGLRVDLIAGAPNFESLAEGLARFADERRASLEAQGLPGAKPSARKRRRKRKAAGTDA